MTFLKCLSVSVLLLGLAVSDTFEFLVASQFNQSVPQEVPSLMDFFQNFKAHLGVPPGDFQEHTITLYLYKGNHQLRRDFLDADLKTLNFRLFIKPYECSQMQIPRFFLCYTQIFDGVEDYPTIEFEYDATNSASPFITFTFNFVDHLYLERVHLQPFYNTLQSLDFQENCENLRGNPNRASLKCEYNLCRRFPDNQDFVAPIFSPKNTASSLTLNTTSVRNFIFPIRAVIEAWNTYDISILSSNFSSINTCDALFTIIQSDNQQGISVTPKALIINSSDFTDINTLEPSLNDGISLVDIPHSSSILFSYNSRMDVQILNSNFVSILNSTRDTQSWKNYKTGALLLECSTSFYLLDTMRFAISTSKFNENQNLNGGIVQFEMDSLSHSIENAQVQVQIQNSEFLNNKVSQFLVKISTLQQKSKTIFSNNEVHDNTLESSLTSLLQFMGDVNPSLTNFYEIIPSPQSFDIFAQSRLASLNNLIFVSHNSFISNQGNSGSIVHIQSGATVHLERNSFQHHRLAAPGACNPLINLAGRNYLSPPIILADNNTFFKMQLSNPISNCGLIYQIQFAGYQTMLCNDHIQGLSSLSNLESLNILGSIVYAYEGNTLKQSESTLKIKGTNFISNVEGSFSLFQSSSSLALQSISLSTSLLKGRGTLIEAADSISVNNLNVANLILRGKLSLIAGAKQDTSLALVNIIHLSLEDGSVVKAEGAYSVKMLSIGIDDFTASIGDSTSIFNFQDVVSIEINDFELRSSQLRSRNTYELCSLFSITNSSSLLISSLLLEENNFDLFRGIQINSISSLDYELFSISIENNQISLSEQGFISVAASNFNLNQIVMGNNQGATFKIASSRLFIPVIEATDSKLSSKPLLHLDSSSVLTVGRLSLLGAQSSGSNLIHLTHQSELSIQNLVTRNLNAQGYSAFKVQNGSKVKVYQGEIDLRQSACTSFLHSITQSEAAVFNTRVRRSQISDQGIQVSVQQLFSAQDYSKISLTSFNLADSLMVGILFNVASYSELILQNLQAGSASAGIAEIESILKSINHGKVSITDSTFQNVKARNRSLIRAHSSSQLKIINTEFLNLQSSSFASDFLILNDATMNLQNASFKQIRWNSSSLFSSTSAKLVMEQATIEAVQTTALVSAYESDIQIKSSKFQASSSQIEGDSRRGLVLQNIYRVQIQGSQFSGFVHHFGSGAALSLTQAQKGEVIITDSDFTKNKAARGAAIYSKGANITIFSSFFVQNASGEEKKEDRITPLNGGAVYYECTDSKIYSSLASNKDCDLILSKTTFARNSASHGGGGAIYWDLAQSPSLSENTFLQNEASYGENLASRAFNLDLINIVEKSSSPALLQKPIRSLASTVISSISQTSGERFNQDISLSVQDYYGNIITNINSLIVEVSLEEVSQTSYTHSMNGITYISCKSGIFNLTDLSVTSLPGSTVHLLITSELIEEPLRISVPIRECREGQRYTPDNRCERCPDGSFSFRAMSEPGECKICPENASCAMEIGIQPHSGHWLLDQNTYPLTVIECPNQEACLGDMECGTEYEGRLCAQCSKAGNGAQLGLYYCPSCQDLVIVTLTAICAIGLAIFLIVITLRALFLNFLNPWEEKSNIIMAARILFTHFHLLVFLFNIDLDWPYWLRTTFYILSGPVTNEATSFLLNCVLNFISGFDQSDMLFIRLVTLLLYPIGLFILVSVLGLLVYCCVIVRNRSMRRRDREQLAQINNLEYGSYQEGSSIEDGAALQESLLNFRAMLFAFICLTYFICYPYLVLQSIEVFSCSKVGTHSYMTLNLNTICWSSQHWTRFISLGILGILIYVITIPLVLICCMRSRLHSYQKDLVLRFMYGIFTAGYPDVKYYLYGLIFARNLILAIISGLFMKDVPSYVAVILILILSAILLLTWKLETFDSAFGQQLSSGSVLISLITLYLAFTYLFTSSEDPSHHHSVTVSVIILLIQGFFIILLIILTLWGFQVDKSQFLTILGRILILGYPITVERHSVIDTAPVRSSIMQKSYNEQYEYEQTASFMNFLREEPDNQRKMKQQLKKSRFEFLKSMSRREGEQLVQSGSSRNLDPMNSSSHRSIFHSTFSESERQF